jgi:predicted extracellular nuclease
MYRSALLSFVSFLLALTCPAHADEWLTVGAWNIENLGQRGGQHPKALAEHLQLVNLDVLALSEIHDKDGNPTTRTSKKLDDTFAIMNARPENDWEYVLFPKKDSDDTEQLVGVAWNKKRVSKEGDPFKIPVVNTTPGFNLWDRHPHAVKFSAGTGETDFVVVPLHMKSNVNGTTFGRNQRRAEAASLVAKLGDVRTHFDDEDIIILGDTNCLNAGEAALQELEAAGFRDLNDQDRDTYRSGSPFDRILVPDAQKEFRYSRQYVLAPTDAPAHDGSLSDHFLVMSIFRIEPDDD